MNKKGIPGNSDQSAAWYMHLVEIRIFLEKPFKCSVYEDFIKKHRFRAITALDI